MMILIAKDPLPTYFKTHLYNVWEDKKEKKK